MTRVKVCGLMNQKDLELCVQAGVHTTGFVVDFPEPVPWNLSPAEARRLIDKVPAMVSSCVVTGGAVDKNSGPGPNRPARYHSTPPPGDPGGS